MKKITKVLALAVLLPFAWPAYADISAFYQGARNGIEVHGGGGGGHGGGHHGGGHHGGRHHGGGWGHHGGYDGNGFFFFGNSYYGDNGDCWNWVPGYWDYDQWVPGHWQSSC